MKIVYTVLAYIVGVTFVAATASLAVLFLVGPHGGVLPQWANLPVLALAWMAVIVLPVLFARWMWRRLKSVE